MFDNPKLRRRRINKQFEETLLALLPLIRNSNTLETKVPEENKCMPPTPLDTKSVIMYIISVHTLP